ncbi:MAG: hypothetical protein Q8O30_01940 [Candidatus Omnitrophota bacterium]|nr:hypothetical protein [Candidatus Omnitrophota bacterium]
MKNQLISLVFITIVLSLSLVGGAFAQDFSADIVNTNSSGTSTGKIFATKNKIRMEVNGVVSITRMDKNVIWVLMPNGKMYMEQPFDPAAFIGVGEKVSGETERTFLGEEMVDGRMAKKYKVVSSLSGKQQTILQWVDNASSIPIKIVAQDNSWAIEYKNLQVGNQSDSLFAFPSDYKKFSITDDISQQLKKLNELQR